MEHIIVETTVAKLIYSSGYPQSSAPGSFIVFDKLREEKYWQVDCYDGGEGRSNKNEQEQREIALEEFIQLNKKLSKVLTDDDWKIIKEITEPVMLPSRNPKYWKH